jgi:hypothetical protein
MAGLALGLVVLGVWLIAALRGGARAPEVQPARTVAAPPETPPSNRPTIAPPPPDAGHAEPPPPARVEPEAPVQNPRAFYQDRLDRERRELEHVRAITEKREHVDPGEQRSAEARLRELERKIRADEASLEKLPP